LNIHTILKTIIVWKKLVPREKARFFWRLWEILGDTRKEFFENYRIRILFFLGRLDLQSR